jgi:acyl carrier protein
MAPSSEDINSQIVEILESTLFPDEGDPIVPGTTLLGDLGAESIDFLDIMHQMEKTFKLTLSRDDFWPDDILSSEELVEDGYVTAAGVAALKERMPYADLSGFEQDPSLKRFGDLLTVGDLCKMVEHKLAGAAGGDGGDSATLLQCDCSRFLPHCQLLLRGLLAVVFHQRNI